MGGLRGKEEAKPLPEFLAYNTKAGNAQEFVWKLLGGPTHFLLVLFSVGPVVPLALTAAGEDRLLLPF